MKHLFIFSALLLLSLASAAQGIIRGKVTDGITGDVLIGANVLIEGTTKGAMVDLDGNFSLEGLEPGTYSISASFISYEKVTETDVVVNDGEVTIINFNLTPATFVIEQAAEVVTKADRSRSTYMESVKKKNASMMDFISSQEIKRTGDSDASSALKRVTGVSTVGNYVFVRGLSDRYLKTTLNGAEIPSLDPKRNSVQMDIFPTNLVDNLVVVKTLQADLPADYSGAFINVITKDFPTEFSFRYSGSFGYNTNATFNDLFLTSERSSTDIWGFDNGFRDIPSSVTDAGSVPNIDVSNFYEALVFAGFQDDLDAIGVGPGDIGTGDGQTPIGDVVNQIEGVESVAQVTNEFLPAVREFNNRELTDMGQSFDNTWDPIREVQNLDISQSISFGNQGKLFGKPLGYVFGLQYKRQNRFYDNGTTGRFKLTGNENTTDVLNTERRLDDAMGVQSTYISALLNFSYKLSGNHKLGFTFMPNVSGINSARYQDGINPSDDIGLGQEQRSVQYLERNMNVYQLRGEHYLPELGRAKIEWLGSYTRGVQNTPDLRMFINSYTESEGGGTFYFDAEGNDVTEDALALLADGENLEEYFPGFTTQTVTGTQIDYEIQDNLYPSPTRYFREMVDGTTDLKAHIEFPFENATGLKNKIRFGGSYVRRTRDYTESRYSFISQNMPYNGDPTAYFAPENMVVIPGNADGYLYLRDDTDIQNTYNASMDVLGVYGMVDWNITSKLRVNTGVRLETTDMLLESAKLLDEELEPELADEFRGSLDLTDVLPSLNVTYLLRQYDLAITNLRFSASRSVARPMFREKAPFSVFDFELQEQQTGNTDLDRTLIDNFDLRLEHYPKPGEIYSVSVFYKNFTNPIEQVIVATAQNTEITWKNVPTATLLGAEFEVRKSLGFLGEGMAPFGIGANLTIVQSATDIEERELEQIRATDVDHADTRPMFGQSPYIINAIATYDNDSLGLNVALTFNIQGEKLVLVTQGGTPDVYDQPVGNLDFTVSKRIGDKFSLGFKARNLLNPIVRQTYEFKGTEYTFQSMQWGRTFSVGFTYDI
jgi:TonB-dependent receptor